jgi:glutathione S-transferase
MLQIREATNVDFENIWPIFQTIASAGDTYAYPVDVTKAEGERLWMELLHERLDFEYIEVDPYRESRWWLDISRNRAKAPVIVSPPGNATTPITVIDSTRVLEYLENLVPDRNPLYPVDANARAELRFWRRPYQRTDDARSNTTCPTVRARGNRTSQKSFRKA